MKSAFLTLSTVTPAFSLTAGACSTATQQKEVTLAQAYSKYFYVGTAVSVGEYGFDSLTAYNHSLLTEYNSLTAENAMKPSVIAPSKGLFNWNQADEIVNFAEKNACKVRGHTFVWHNQTPNWLTNGNKAIVKNNMREYIKAILERYKGKIYAWDVVNEAIADSDDLLYRTNSPWYKAYGDESYIKDAFIVAKEEDPQALLFYNDYNVVSPAKRVRIVKMIQELDLKNCGLDGIGIQGHWNLNWPSLKDIQDTLDVFSKMGLKIHITELDIDCYRGSVETTEKHYDSQLDEELAKRYKEIFELFRLNRDKITSVTFWGTTDNHTWLDTFYGGKSGNPKRKNYPMLFDADHKPKSAYYAVRNF